MNKKIFGTTLGAVALLLWFMPFVNIDASAMGFGRMVPAGATLYQSGQHIGGIAYLLLLAGAAVSVLAWLEKRLPLLIASGLGAAVCGLFLIQAGGSAAWGLIVETVCFVIAGALAFLTQAEKRTGT